MDIDHKSKVPLFAVLISIPVLISCVAYAVTIDWKASSAYQETKDLRSLVLDIKQDLIKIKVHLKIKEENE